MSIWELHDANGMAIVYLNYRTVAIYYNLHLYALKTKTTVVVSKKVGSCSNKCHGYWLLRE